MSLSSLLQGRTFHWVTLAALLATVFLLYGNRVDDLDLWWHLKSGESIVASHAIPRADTFSYTSAMAPALAELGRDEVPASLLPSGFPHWQMNLSHSWLGQVVMYLVFRDFGFAGLGVLKSALFVVAYAVLSLAMRRAGAGPVASLFTLALVAFIGKDFNYTRPQLFTFVALAILLYLLADFRAGGKKIVALPLLLLAWANLHGGFIVGVAVFLLFVAGEGLRFQVQGRRGEDAASAGRRLRLLLMVSALGLAAALVNPNGYRIFLFPSALRHSLFYGGIEEYLRPMFYEYHAFWFMFLLVGAALPFRLWRQEFAEAAMVLFLMVSASTALRAIPLFAMGSGVLLARWLSLGSTWLAARRWLKNAILRFSLDGAGTRLAGSVLLAAGPLLLLAGIATSGPVLDFSVSGRQYPAEAVRFIKDNRLPGPLFNPYNWGGYLIWNLPEQPVFIDGRCLSETAYSHYQLIVGAVPGQGQPALWKRLLDAHQVRMIMSPAVTGNGGLVALVDALYFDPGWELIYLDGKTLLFLRNNRDNARLIGKYALPKQLIMDEIIAECERGIRDSPATWGYYETAGYVLMNRGQVDTAKAMFRRYLAMNPYNKGVRETLQMLERLPKAVGG
ncbi:MAG: hypothetical protein OEV91_06760 [Desulfobulbaceae bacterium]|nr:hypothetical protein [Desulfobulbaceae bacterium]